MIFTTVNTNIGPKQYKHWHLMVRVVFVRQSSGGYQVSGSGGQSPQKLKRSY